MCIRDRSIGISSLVSGISGMSGLINPEQQAYVYGTATPGQGGYGDTTPEGTQVGFDSSGNEMSYMPGYTPGDNG